MCRVFSDVWPPLFMDDLKTDLFYLCSAVVLICACTDVAMYEYHAHSHVSHPPLGRSHVTSIKTLLRFRLQSWMSIIPTLRVCVCVRVHHFGMCVWVVTRTYPPSRSRLQHPHRWFVRLYSSFVMWGEKPPEEKQLGRFWPCRTPRNTGVRPAEHELGRNEAPLAVSSNHPLSPHRGCSCCTG